MSEREIRDRITTAAKAMVDALAAARAWAPLREREISRWLQGRQEALQRVQDAQKSARRRDLDESFARAGEIIQEAETQLGLSAASWDDPAWLGYIKVTTQAPALRIGTLQHRGASGTLSASALWIRGGQGLVLKASGAEKQQAYDFLRGWALRWLAMAPPGRVKLLCIDPVHIGNTFGTLTSLNRINPDLIHGQVWVEQHDVDRVLAELTKHMEVVVQTRFEGKFKTIEEFNDKAGPLAEPYRLVVISDFPAGFSSGTVQKLATIMKQGPRCGVYAAVMIDPTQPVPHGVDLSGIEGPAQVVAFVKGRWNWSGSPRPDLGFELDKAPNTAVADRIIKEVGPAARQAADAALPLSASVRPESEWWTGSTTEEISVPVGWSGANQPMLFSLGKGLTQHGLIIGQTHSGKSVLLHVLILQLAMKYSPEELQLYLIDFKSGVEFKPYAAIGLPHVRLIAIDSERDFGVSVLEDLKEQMLRRGELLRTLRVGNLWEYRTKPELEGERKRHGNMPRILLLVDEFSDFFRENDALATKANLALTLLAREGRYVGIHVLMASQGMGGEQPLEKEARNQMALRMALACVNHDFAQVIRDDPNLHASLTRPGLAIHNHKHGEPGADTSLQVFWVSRADIESYVRRIRAFAQRCGVAVRSPFVFEGKALPRVQDRDDHPLAALIAGSNWPTPHPAPAVWLGEPLAMAPPTSALLNRARGRNLLMVGTDRRAALGMIFNAWLGLAATLRPEQLSFWICNLNPSSGDGPPVEVVLARCVPHNVRTIPSRKLVPAVYELSDMVARRNAADDTGGPTACLTVLGLHQAADIGYDADQWDGRLPYREFNNVLKLGPDLGVHVLAWTDSFQYLNALIDRRVLQEFGIRIAMQMGESDSQDTIGNYSASKLCNGRALLRDATRGTQLETFRPYDMPSGDWLAQVGTRLRTRDGSGRNGR